jgi:hypothetical protein
MEAVSSIPASGDNASEAVMSEAWRVFLQSGYRAGWTLRVSRYKVSKWTGIYPGIVILLTVVARACPELAKGPDLSFGSIRA